MALYRITGIITTRENGTIEEFDTIPGDTEQAAKDFFLYKFSLPEMVWTGQGGLLNGKEKYDPIITDCTEVSE